MDNEERLQKEVDNLNETLEKKDDEIVDLEARIKELENLLDDVQEVLKNY